VLDGLPICVYRPRPTHNLTSCFGFLVVVVFVFFVCVGLLLGHAEHTVITPPPHPPPVFFFLCCWATTLGQERVCAGDSSFLFRPSPDPPNEGVDRRRSIRVEEFDSDFQASFSPFFPPRFFFRLSPSFQS